MSNAKPHQSFDVASEPLILTFEKIALREPHQGRILPWRLRPPGGRPVTGRTRILDDADMSSVIPRSYPGREVLPTCRLCRHFVRELPVLGHMPNNLRQKRHRPPSATRDRHLSSGIVTSFGDNEGTGEILAPGVLRRVWVLGLVVQIGSA